MGKGVTDERGKAVNDRGRNRSKTGRGGANGLESQAGARCGPARGASWTGGSDRAAREVWLQAESGRVR